MRFFLTGDARSDIEEADAHYADIDPELATRFINDLEMTLELIAMFPQGSPPVDGFEGLRRARMRRFPYGVFHQQISAGDLLFVRVLHARRHDPDALGD